MGPHQRGSRSPGLIYLDTHALVWIRHGKYDWLSRRAQAAVERSDVLASPMAVLELQTLYEINRVSERPEDIVAELSITLGLQVCNHPWSLVVRAATEIQWTRDPFDRLIVAHAQARKAPLLTTDRHILRHYERAIS